MMGEGLHINAEMPHVSWQTINSYINREIINPDECLGRSRVFAYTMHTSIRQGKLAEL
jgi:hypothetical protein